MRRRGFSLTELLVVIAIIAVLAGIIFPVFVQAREKARQTACASNIKQLGIAMMAYAQDNEDQYPPPPYSAQIAGQVRFVWWMDIIFPYVRNGAVYACPSNPGETDMELMTNESPDRGGCLGGSRGLFIGNYRYLGYSVNRSLTARPLIAAHVPRPSDTCVLFDSYPLCLGDPPAPSRSWISRPGRDPRHHEGLNVVYADGHVRYQKARWNEGQATWVVNGGPYDDRPGLHGIVMDDGTLWTP